jgi:hypothetical protein
MSENSKYQTLRAHLAFLRMSAAAEALPERPSCAYSSTPDATRRAVAGEPDARTRRPGPVLVHGDTRSMLPSGLFAPDPGDTLL